jgi:hypothetical protein
VQTQADLGLCCAVFCAAPSSVGYSTNIGKGPNVVVIVVIFNYKAWNSFLNYNDFES